MRVILTEGQLKSLIGILFEDVMSGQTNQAAPQNQPVQQVTGQNTTQAAQIGTTEVQGQPTPQTGQPDQQQPQAAAQQQASTSAQTMALKNINTKKAIKDLKKQADEGTLTEEDASAALQSIGLIGNLFNVVFSFLFGGVGSCLGDSPLGQTYNSWFNGLFTGLDSNVQIAPGDFTPSSSWMEAVRSMANWYQKNVHTYQGGTHKPWPGRKNYVCSEIGGGTVQDDCSSFVKACLIKFGRVPGIANVHVTTASMQPGGKFNQILQSNGFALYKYSPQTVAPGDIICGGPKTHTEIYAGNGKSYSWGSIHDIQHGGLPCGMAKSTNYVWIWRYVG